MTIEEADQIFTEIGEALTAKAMTEPHRFGPKLRCASRREIRMAIMLWLAKHQFQGRDLLGRVDTPQGRFPAPQELTDTLWQTSRMLGWSVHDPNDYESSEAFSEACKFYDSFTAFLHDLPPGAPDFWSQVHRRLFAF